MTKFNYVVEIFDFEGIVDTRIETDEIEVAMKEFALAHELKRFVIMTGKPVEA